MLYVPDMKTLVRIREVPLSNFCQKDGYPNTFRGFPEFVQANTDI